LFGLATYPSIGSFISEAAMRKEEHATPSFQRTTVSFPSNHSASFQIKFQTPAAE